MARNHTVPTPFPFLTAADLCGALATFQADSAVVSLNYERDGVTTILSRRDLYFIHSLDAGRFGPTAAACPVCREELAD